MCRISLLWDVFLEVTSAACTEACYRWRSRWNGHRVELHRWILPLLKPAFDQCILLVFITISLPCPKKILGQVLSRSVGGISFTGLFSPGRIIFNHSWNRFTAVFVHLTVFFFFCNSMNSLVSAWLYSTYRMVVVLVAVEYLQNRRSARRSYIVVYYKVL